MKEILTVQQRTGESPRRWFSDEYFDLIVWGAAGRVTAFQLAYDKGRRERVIAWRESQGLSHFQVDYAGDRPARHGRTGFLKADPAADLTAVVERFEDASHGIDPRVASVVRGKLRDFVD